MTTQGRITRDELFSRIESGEIDTVITAVTDMQGRLQGKRIDATFFMEDLKDGVVEGFLVHDTCPCFTNDRY
jgi:glutamine synthetase